MQLCLFIYLHHGFRAQVFVLEVEGVFFPFKKMFERKYTIQFLKIAYLILHKAKYHTRLRLPYGIQFLSVLQS